MALHVADINVAVVVTLQEDGRPFAVPSGSSIQMRFMRPDRSILSKVGSTVSGGADGKVQCIMDDGDLTVPGLWAVETTVQCVDGKWTTNQVIFDVQTTLEWAATH